jgi:hypothetical protein
MYFDLDDEIKKYIIIHALFGRMLRLETEIFTAMGMSATHGNGGSNNALAAWPFIQLRHHGYRVSQLTSARTSQCSQACSIDLIYVIGKINTRSRGQAERYQSGTTAVDRRLDEIPTKICAAAFHVYHLRFP